MLHATTNPNAAMNRKRIAPTTKHKLCAFHMIARMLGVAALFCAFGCAKIPEGRLPINDVSLRGNDALDDDDVLDRLATIPSSKFLGLFRGVVYDYETFDPATVQRDLARIEHVYQSKGYFDAHARAAHVFKTKDDHVKVEFVVEEGEPTLNRDLAIVGIESLPPDIQRAVRRAIAFKLRKGTPFEDERFKNAETDALTALTSRGYAFATVKREVNIDIVGRGADATFTVSPGEPATFGPLTIVGLDPDGPGPQKAEIDEAPVRRVLDISEGGVYSSTELEEATQAVLDLQVFASAEMIPDLTHPESHVVPITLKLEPTRVRQVRLGFGVEFDFLKTDFHLITGWQDRNFLGDLRDFSVDFTPGVVFYPLRFDNIVTPEKLLPQEKLRLQLRQQGFIDARTTAFVRPEFNIFPMLLQTQPRSDVAVIGYREFKGGIGVERNFFRNLYVNLSYNTQVEDPFAYVKDLDPSLRTLVIAYPELLTQLDFRDDRVHPHKGILLGNDLQIAGTIFGGDASDIKVQPEVRTYLPLGRRLTFATRASVGFLFSSNYGDVVKNQLSEPVTDANRAARTRDIQTVFFRGFFSGGPTSNRGYPIRGIAPKGVIPFLNPATASQQIANKCDPNNPDENTAADCAISVGGFALWEFSNELRYAIAGPVSAAAFCDMSDVSTGAIRLNRLHLSCGLGGRYDTPVGPIRLDIGYRVQPLQVLGYKNEQAVYAADPTEGLPPQLFDGVPIAIAFGIGEAF